MALRSKFTIEPLEDRTLLATVPSGFTDTQVAAGLTSPTAMDIAPDGRVFVSQQGGVIRVIKNGALLSTPFYSLPNVVSNEERGFLGIELDPNFAQNSYVYVYYTTSEGGTHNRLARLTANGDVAAGGSLTTLVDLPAIGTAIWHMGGAIHFGADGKLYLGVGDHQQPAQAQSLTSVFGKLLRLNPDGSIPTDNPFYNQTTGIFRAIWARGFRNPYTFDIQRTTGKIYVNDVGQETYEEVNLGVAGANYGWPNSEGPNNTSGFTAPAYYYNHNTGAFAVTGGAFYNPTTSQFPSQYVGKYFFADLTGNWLKTLDPNNNSVANFATGLSAPVDVDVAPDGSIYYLQRTGSISNGSVRKISSTSAPVQQPQIIDQPETQSVFTGQNVTFTVSATGSGLSYQWLKDNQNISGETGSSLTLEDVDSNDQGDYRVRVSNTAGNVLSDPATLTVTDQNPPVAVITSPLAGTTFRAGQTFTLTGTGTDTEDGTLGGSAFTWQVDYHTGAVVRPFIPPTTGQTSLDIDIPVTTPYKQSDVFYRIRLTVTDSNGATNTVTRDLQPLTGVVKVTTNIGSIQLTIDDQPKQSPTAFTGVVGITRSLGTPETVTVGGINYVFYGWSDGGEREHEISTPSGNTTYVARYKPTYTINQVHTLNSTADAYVSGGDRTANFGSQQSLFAKTSPNAKYQRDIYLKFDIRDVDPDVKDAKLRIFGGLNSTVDQNVDLGVYHAPNAKWDQSTIHYANRPATNTKALNWITVSNDTQRWYEIDLTAFIAGERARGRTIVTLVLRNLEASSAVTIFNSREAANNKPELVVTN